MMKIAVAFVAISVAALVLAQRETSVEGQLEVHIYVNILVLYTHIYVQGSSQSDEEEPSPNCSTGGARGDVGRRPRPGGDVYCLQSIQFCFVFFLRDWQSLRRRFLHWLRTLFARVIKVGYSLFNFEFRGECQKCYGGGERGERGFHH